MSSHHFVREQQEPALILAIADLPDYVLDLLEWAPTIIALEIALPAALENGFKVDVIITEKDHNKWLEAFHHQHPLLFLKSNTGLASISMAMDHLIDQRQKTVNIVCPDAHQLINGLEKFTALIEINLLSGPRRYTHHNKGKFQKWLPSGTLLESPDSYNLLIKSGNVVHEGDCYRVLSDGIIHLQADGPFWLAEKI